MPLPSGLRHLTFLTPTLGPDGERLPPQAFWGNLSPQTIINICFSDTCPSFPRLPVSAPGSGSPSPQKPHSTLGRLSQATARIDYPSPGRAEQPSPEEHGHRGGLFHRRFCIACPGYPRLPANPLRRHIGPNLWPRVWAGRSVRQLAMALRVRGRLHPFRDFPSISPASADCFLHVWSSIRRAATVTAQCAGQEPSLQVSPR